VAGLTNWDLGACCCGPALFLCNPCDLAKVDYVLNIPDGSAVGQPPGPYAATFHHVTPTHSGFTEGWQTDCLNGYLFIMTCIGGVLNLQFCLSGPLDCSAPCSPNDPGGGSCPFTNDTVNSTCSPVNLIFTKTINSFIGPCTTMASIFGDGPITFTVTP
jgi:hypothetical protein